MNDDMDNLSTKPPSRYDGTVNVLSDQKTFSMDHIYLHQYLVWLYLQEYGVTTTDIFTRWVATIYNIDYVPVYSIVRGIRIIN